MKYFVNVGGEPVTVEFDNDWVRVDGEPVDVSISYVAGEPTVVVALDGAIHRIAVQTGKTKDDYTLFTDHERFDAEVVDERLRAIRELAGSPQARHAPSALRAPMPGLIVRVDVARGDQVRAGQGLLVMEAMKMENELRVAAGGTVKAVHVEAGSTVEKGALLVELE